jgi:hypothetical protein
LHLANDARPARVRRQARYELSGENEDRMDFNAFANNRAIALGKDIIRMTTAAGSGLVPLEPTRQALYGQQV